VPGSQPIGVLAVRCALVSHRPGEGGERRRGNKKGTNSSPPDGTGRTKRTAIVLRTPPPVLNSTAVHCGPPFGTKRPQVQILSPRLYSRRSEARTRNGEGLSCCQYRNEIPQVPQQIRILTCLSNRLPPARFALSAGEEAAEGKCQIEHSKGLPQPALRLEVAIGLAFEQIPNVIDTSA
jgi:hypothetical protein